MPMLWNWKHVQLEDSHNPPVPFLFLKSPSLPSPSLFFWIANLFPTLPSQHIHIFVKIYISSRFYGVIYVAPTLPIDTSHLFFFFSSWHTPPIFFSSSLIINWIYSSYLYSWSRPISPVSLVFFCPHQLLPLSQAILDHRLPPPEFYPQLTLYISHMFFFWLCISYPSVPQ